MKIAFVGKAGSGKTTVSRFLVNRYAFHRLSFAKKLKDFAMSILGRPLNKKTDRVFLQALSTARNVDAKVWIKHFSWALYQKEEAGIENIVVDDCRFINEAKFLRAHGFIIIKIVGRSYEKKGKLSKQLASHKSETEQDYIEADHELDSSGTMEHTCNNMVRLLHKIVNAEKVGASLNYANLSTVDFRNALARYNMRRR